MAKSVRKSVSAPKAPAKSSKPVTKKTSPSNGNGTGTGTQVSYDQVAQLAHQFFVERGCEHGHDAEDWSRAEQELRARAS
ncbi:MAG: DUF2934 domain-containing protein [Terracidiphilus sp.]